MPVNIEKIREAIIEGKYQWRLHALTRLAERGIAQQEVLEAILSGECIEQYPDDTPFPSALFLSEKGRDEPLHVVISYDPDAELCYIITSYVPDPEHFEDDWRTRRKP